MPGSTTTRGRPMSRDRDTGRIAFCRTEMFQFDDVFEQQIAVCHRPDQLQALRFRKDKQYVAVDFALENLMHRDELA